MLLSVGNVPGILFSLIEPLKVEDHINGIGPLVSCYRFSCTLTADACPHILNKTFAPLH